MNSPSFTSLNYTSINVNLEWTFSSSCETSRNAGKSISSTMSTHISPRPDALLHKLLGIKITEVQPVIYLDWTMGLHNTKEDFGSDKTLLKYLAFLPEWIYWQAEMSTFHGPIDDDDDGGGGISLLSFSFRRIWSVCVQSSEFRPNLLQLPSDNSDLSTASTYSSEDSHQFHRFPYYL